MRTITLVLALCLGLAPMASALETPLVLRPPGGSNNELTIVLNPSLGTIQLYRVGGQSLILQSSHNFLADLETFRLISVPGKEGEMAWPLLRTGTATTRKTYAEMFSDYFGSAAPRSRRAEGPTLAQRAHATEEAFWAQGAPEYDGVIRAAMGPNSLVLLLPGSYTLLVYQIQNFEVSLAAVRNYRPDLYIPQAIVSTPLPQELLQKLGEEIQGERREALRQQMEEVGEGDAATIPLAKSEAWISSMGANPERFVMVDPANKRVVMYQFQTRGKSGEFQLLDVRNIEIDLLIPTVYQSTPTLTNAVIDYNKRLARITLPNRQKVAPVSSAQLRKLTGARAVRGEGISPVQMTLDQQQGLLLIDFSQQSKMFVYRLRERIELLAARDYSVETGMGLHSRELLLRMEAHKQLPQIEALARRRDGGPFALERARRALEWDPRLGADMEKGRIGQSLSRLPDIAPQWQALLEEAAAKTAQLIQEEERILKEIEEEAAAAAGRGRGR